MLSILPHHLWSYMYKIKNINRMFKLIRFVILMITSIIINHCFCIVMTLCIEWPEQEIFFSIVHQAHLPPLFYLLCIRWKTYFTSEGETKPANNTCQKRLKEIIMLFTALNLISWLHISSFNDLESGSTQKHFICFYFQPVCMLLPPPLSLEPWHTFWREVRVDLRYFLQIHRFGTKPPFSFTVLECFLASRSSGEYGANRNPSSPVLQID